MKTEVERIKKAAMLQAEMERPVVTECPGERFITVRRDELSKYPGARVL